MVHADQGATDEVAGDGAVCAAGAPRQLFSVRRLLEVVERVDASSPVALHTLLARRAREQGETTAALLEGLADGALSDEELERVSTELRDEERVIAELRSSIDAERSRRRTR